MFEIYDAHGVRRFDFLEFTTEEEAKEFCNKSFNDWNEHYPSDYPFQIKKEGQ